MKKLSLLLIGLCLTLLSQSQDFKRVLKSTKLEFNSDKWTVVETQYPTDLFVILKDWNITIGSYKLKTYDSPEKSAYDTHIVFSWKAVDQEGNKCVFMIKSFKQEITNHIVYSVVYEQYLTMYEYETE
jgi:hypothetical protein